MMYVKLTFRNIRRSLRDYIIYFITLTLTSALMYSFLALGFSPDIIAMTENMSILTSGILILSVLIAFISSFVIGYAVRFTLGQRRKEFAVYELLGMENKTVRNLFLAENIIIGGGAFLLGSLVGTGVSGLLGKAVTNVFEVPHVYQISFSFHAWAVTFLFFTLMYGFGMLWAAKVIRRRKIIDLLYDVQKNETYRFQSVRQGILKVSASTIAIVSGAALLLTGLHLQTNEACLYLSGASLLILAGAYELHRQFPSLLFQFIKRNPYKKYKGENLFLLGQAGRRIQSSGRTMAATAILLTVSLAAMFIGLTWGAGYKANMEAYYPYDVGIAVDAPFTKNSMDSAISFVEERCTVKDSLVYYLYSVPNAPIEALSLSDYNHLRNLLGLSPVSVSSDEYLVHCDTWFYIEKIQTALEQTPEITLTGQTFAAASNPILTEPMEQYRMAGTNGYVLILPDQAARQLPGNKIRAVMKLENGGYPELKDEVNFFLNSNNWRPEVQNGYRLPEQVTLGVSVKAWGVANSLTGFTAISFCGLYLSIIFIILSCAVLAFEQLSALDKNRKNYEVIRRLGVPGQKQAALIRKELSAFFFIPLLFPVFFTVLLIVGAQIVYGDAILQGGLVPLYGMITILIFCTIYFIYFSATMFLYKHAILQFDDVPF